MTGCHAGCSPKKRNTQYTTHPTGPHTLAGVLSRPSSAESSEDGFKLFCSQTYQRQSSQETDPGEEEKTSDQSEDEEGYQRVSFAGDAGEERDNLVMCLNTQPVPA